MIIAIDPGASGGIAVQGSAGTAVHSMPSTEGDIISLLRKYTRMADNSPPPGTDKIAYVEQIVKHMGEGIPASTMAVYASNWGIIIGALMMAGWSVTLVRPADWQKALGLGITGRQKANLIKLPAEKQKNKIEVARVAELNKAEKKRVQLLNSQLKREWKNKLKAAAQRLYPSESATLKTADALLILRYAVMQESLLRA